ncbi:hypothetical protein C8Q80DRAFT_1206581 [Daedaleopsis nitida]|nr:hypothetical protein C8Q80DRAFT_1206581 [Daedaleopsis nitida]
MMYAFILISSIWDSSFGFWVARWYMTQGSNQSLRETPDLANQPLRRKLEPWRETHRKDNGVCMIHCSSVLGPGSMSDTMYTSIQVPTHASYGKLREATACRQQG